ncbi:MAG: PD-(D/E)XK nuclease family protein [Alphaproteobacteria bacterium]|nr:PD-(D/E)XK nuclease family protein [Alphaproteobacteria bacterium]
MIFATSLSDSLAERIIDMCLVAHARDPLKLAQTKIILPTRRACRTIQETFLQQSAERPMMLPQLIPLYELEAPDEQISDAVEPLERALLLTRLCLEKPNVTAPDQAVKIAVSLGAILDEFYQFGTDTAALRDLAPAQPFAQHWNETLVFLNIICDEWPKILKERGQIDAVDRRARMIRAYARQLKQDEAPLIIAGLDGSLPVVRDLIQAVSGRAGTTILLDGLDNTPDADAFKALPPNHYQYALKDLLDRLGKTARDIPYLSTAMTPQEPLIRAAFKPAAQTEQWRDGALKPDCLANIDRIDCQTPAEEALTIALLLREALETPRRTACLVTPDRNLARRVIVEMRRFGVDLNDSAGTPLAKTPVGTFLSLIAAYGLKHAKSADIIPLLKHGLTADGRNPEAFRSKLLRAEHIARQEARPLDIKLKTEFSGWTRLFDDNRLMPFGDVLQAHMALAEQLAATDAQSGSERLWTDEAGQSAHEFLTNLLAKSDLLGEVESLFYPEILSVLMNALTMRPKYGLHPRLNILGPIESRFFHADVCIIGGLNEGVFPAVPDTGPWLNRAMRQKLGLPDLESKTAGMAMDFAHCFCAPKVYLTRAVKADGTQTIPSRFLARLEGALEGSHLKMPVSSGDWAMLLNRPERHRPIARPQPKPPAAVRPKRLSVTKIEEWRRNPYAIYARYILRLKKLEALDADLADKNHGTAIHMALERFYRLPAHERTQETLVQLGRAAFADTGFRAVDLAFYMPRFEKIADFVVAQSIAGASHTERKGRIELKTEKTDFTLTCQADRIDISSNNRAGIVDYKTGEVPSAREVAAGFSPQLPLEGLIAQNGGFEGLPPLAVEALHYWHLTGKDGGGVISAAVKPAEDISAEIAKAEAGLKKMIDTFADPDTPYEATPLPGKAPKYNDYAHLAREQEWQRATDDKEAS